MELWNTLNPLYPLHEIAVILGHFWLLVAYCSFQYEEYIYYVSSEKAPCLIKIYIIKSWTVWAKSLYLLYAWELWQNNALALQFWCLSNALSLRVRAFQNLSVRALFCHKLAEVNMRLLIYKLMSLVPCFIGVPHIYSLHACYEHVSNLRWAQGAELTKMFAIFIQVLSISFSFLFKRYFKLDINCSIIDTLTERKGIQIEVDGWKSKFGLSWATEGQLPYFDKY